MHKAILALAIVVGQLIKVPIQNFGGVTVLDLTAALLVIIGLIRLKFKLTKPPNFIIAASIFLLVGAISLAFTPLKLAYFDYLFAAFYLVRMSVYILLGWIIFSKGFDISKELIFATGVSLSILGLLQFIFWPNLGFLESQGWDPHFYRTASTFLDPNFLGAFLAICILLKFPNLKSIGLVYLTLLLTFSRSSYLMFFVGTLSLGLLQKSKRLILTSIMLSGLLLLGFQIYTEVISKPMSINRAKSASFRFNTWQQGLEIFQRSPILGVGYNTYRFALKEYRLADSQFLVSHGSSSNDSSLLFVLATTGIVGAIAYLCFLFFIAKSNITALSALLGLGVHSIFNNSLFYPPILLLLILLPTLKAAKR